MHLIIPVTFPLGSGLNDEPSRYKNHVNPQLQYYYPISKIHYKDIPPQVKRCQRQEGLL